MTELLTTTTQSAQRMMPRNSPGLYARSTPSSPPRGDISPDHPAHVVTASVTQVDGRRSSDAAAAPDDFAGAQDSRAGLSDTPHLPTDNAFRVRGVNSSHSGRGHSHLDPRQSTRDDGQSLLVDERSARPHGTTRHSSQPYYGSRLGC